MPGKELSLLKASIFLLRSFGIMLPFVLIALSGSLHGCAQHYGDKTQSVWLHKQPNPVFQTELLPVDDTAAMSFSGKISTMVSGALESPVITELSGLVASRVQANVFWAINDSGNLPELFAIRPDGKHLASFNLPFKNRDWEDLASFQDRGQSWLVVADTGDNVRQNKVSTLHLFHEPVLPQTNHSIVNHRKLDFTYEDGPQNVESIAVSVKEQLIFLVSKNSGAAKVHVLPLGIATGNPTPDQGAEQPLLAKFAGHMKPLTWTKDGRRLEKKFASGILLGATSMDISADDSMAVVSNYRHAYLFKRKPQQTWLQALQTSPQNITTHLLAQSESVAFSHDAGSILIGSEGRYAPLLTVKSAIE